MKFIWCLLGVLLVPAWAPRAVANNAGAVVLVNSHSANYPDYVHFLQPYLGNFGVPYNVLDISSNTVGNTLTNYALIIIGHSQLDTNHLYLSAAGQNSISQAVSNGVGLVSFDNVLATNNTAIYQFEQNIFGFGYKNASTAGTVEFAPTEPQSKMHYITSLHVTNDTLLLSNSIAPTVLTVAGLTFPTNVTAVATCGGAPFVMIKKVGLGRAVQWASYDWMSSNIQGPVNGLDDLVWRGFVWAARKPFIMRGMPNLVTMRVDDVTGDMENLPTSPPAMWWVHEMVNTGFKPWLALFTDDINYASRYWPADGRLLDLSNMVASGSVTASVHAFSSSPTNFFFFDHTLLTEWPDSVVSNHFAAGTAFLQAAGIPSSKVVIAHYNEIGTNACAGLTNWGVQYIMDMVPPGTTAYEQPYAQWLVGGPYRLHETPGLGNSPMPFYYADWLTVPGHPELNGKFFNCYTEIRNVGVAPEWAPTNGDLSASIQRGYQMLKRGFDSLTLATVFTHEFYINPSDGPGYGGFNTNNFLTVLQGITNDIGPYRPIYVTMDYACQYVRATRTAQIISGDYNPQTGQVTGSFSGSTDLPITAYCYTGADSAITNNAATVPVFSGSTNVFFAALSTNKPVLLVAADPKSRMYAKTNPALTYTITGFVGTDTVAVVKGAPRLTTTAVTGSPVGAYPINITSNTLSATNYTFAFSNSTLTVTQAPLGVTAVSTNRIYWTTNPLLTVSYTGFVNNDRTNVLLGTPSLTTSAATNSPAGAYPIVATQGTLAATNYFFNFTNGTLTVTQAVLVVSADNQGRLYGAANPALTYSFSGYVGTDTVAVVSGSPGLGTAAAANSPVGTYPISITNVNLSAANYSFQFTNGALTVAKATLLAGADNQSRLYGGVNPALTYSFYGLQGTDTLAVVHGVAGLGTAAVTNSPVGPYPITITNINLTATNYNFAFSNGVLAVNPAPLGVTADPKSRAYGTTNPLFTASYSGFVNHETNTVLSGSPSLTTPATVASNAGSYPIIAAVGTLAAANYTFNFTNGVLTVNPVPLGVTADPKSRAYGAANPPLTASYSGFVNGDTPAVLSGSPSLTTPATASSGVGSYPINAATGTLTPGNYTYSFTNGTLTVGPSQLLVSADNQGRLYGATNPVLTYTVSGLAGTDTVAVVSGSPGLATAAATNSPVGTYPITITNINLSATNYNLVFSNGVLAVNPALLGVTADPKSRAYGAANPPFTASYSGFVNGDTPAILSGSPSLTTSATVNSNAGNYPITAATGTLASANYTFNFTNGVLTVNPTPLGVTADPKSRAYGAANPPFTASYSGFVNGDTPAILSGSPSLSTSATVNSNAGSYPITAATGTLASANYTFNFTNGVLTVNPAPLGVTADSKSRVYGATNPPFTASYSGFVNGDTPAVLSGSPALTTSATTNSGVGSYPINTAAGTLAAGNYTFNFTNGTLTVGASQLLVSADNQGRRYGAANPALTYTLSGFVGTDTVAVVSGSPGLGTTASANSPVGAYPITLTNINLTATNYSPVFSNGVLTVNRALLGVTADSMSRAYGATNPPLTASYSGFVNGDTLAALSGSPSLTTSATTNSGVGSYPIIAAAGTLAATNYTFNYTNGTLTVGQSQLLVSADNQGRRYGATNPVLTYAISGFVGTDTVAVVSGGPGLATVADTSSPAGTYPITITNINLSATNYNLVFSNGVLAVNPALLGVTADSKSRAYGAANPPLTASYSGFVNGETPTVLSGSPSLTTSATTTSGVGGYPVNAAAGTLAAGNYTFNFTNGVLTVGPAPLGVTADSMSRAYGATNPPLTASYSGFVNGDTPAILSGSPSLTTSATTNSGVGTYPINAAAGTLAADNYTFNFTNGTLTVDTAQLLVSADNQGRLYGATNPLLTYTIIGFVGTDTVAVVSGSPGLATVADTNSPVGTYPITITNLDLSATNYNLVFSNGVLAVNPAPLGVTADSQTRQYGAANPPFTASYSGFVNNETRAVLSGSPSLTTTATAASDAGSYPIMAGMGGLTAGNYAFNFTNGTLTVGKMQLLVSADSQSRVYGGANPPLTYSFSGYVGTDTVAMVSGSPALGTVANTASPTGTYSITITNGSLSATNYDLVFSNGVLTVNPAPLGVTADPKSRAYGADNPPFTASYSGFVNGETPAVLSGTPSLTTSATLNSGVGSYPISAAAGTLAAGNYTFNFTNGTLSVGPSQLLVSADNQSRPYGGTNPVFTYTFSGFVGTDTVAVVTGGPGLGTTAATNSPAGTYPITITNNDLSAANYNLVFSNAVLTVNPALLGVTADPQSRNYGADNPPFTASYSGFVNGDTSSVLSGSPSLTSPATVSSNAGSYPIIAAAGTLVVSNYAFNFTNGVLTVNPAPLGVTADSISRVYGADNPPFTASYSGFVNGDTPAVLSGTPSLTTPATLNCGVGSYPINAAAGTLAAGNYIFNFTNGTLTVGPSQLLVSADNQRRLHGATNPVLTCAISGFVGTDTMAMVSGGPLLSTTADTGSPVGTYPISVTAGNLGATNYYFAFTNGTLTVTPTAPAILSITGAGTTNVVLTWSALSNVTYRVQYSSDLSAHEWHDLTPDVTATNDTATTVDNPGTAPQRFYRLTVP